MKNEIIKSALILSGISVTPKAEIGTMCHVPAQKMKPGKEFVENNYMEPRYVMGKYVPQYSGELSEKRKRILQDIRTTRNQIRVKQEQIDLEREDMALMELLQRVTVTTQHRIAKAIKETAIEYNLPERLVPEEIALQNKGMLVIDLDIA